MAVTPASWAQSFLDAIGAPVSATNVQAVTAWESVEGGNWANPDTYNPLNTTLAEPGAVATNSAGVKAYTSWAQGLDATVATIDQPAYAGILAQLRAGTTPPATIASNPELATWGTGSFVGALPGASAYNTAHGGAGGDVITTSSSPSSSTSSGAGGGEITLLPGISVPVLGTIFPGVHLSTGTAVRVGLGLVGIIVLFIAANAITRANPSDGPITVVAKGAKAAQEGGGSSHTPMHRRAGAAAETGVRTAAEAG